MSHKEYKYNSNSIEYKIESLSASQIEQPLEPVVDTPPPTPLVADGGDTQSTGAPAADQQSGTDPKPRKPPRVVTDKTGAEVDCVKLATHYAELLQRREVGEHGRKVRPDPDTIRKLVQVDGVTLEALRGMWQHLNLRDKDTLGRYAVNVQSFAALREKWDKLLAEIQRLKQPKNDKPTDWRVEFAAKAKREYLIDRGLIPRDYQGDIDDFIRQQQQHPGDAQWEYAEHD